MSSHYPSILIVCEDPTQRDALFELVELVGYRAVTASPTDAPRILASHRFAAVMIAWDLPDLAGLIAVDGATRPILIAVTADRGADVRRRCLGAGADDHLALPLDREALSACLGRHLAAATLLDEAMVATLRRLNLVAHLYPAFLADLPAQVAALRVAIADGDRNQIRQRAHRLHGAAAQMGAAALARALQRVEAAARSHEERPVEPLGDDFTALVEATLMAVTRELGASGGRG